VQEIETVPKSRDVTAFLFGTVPLKRNVPLEVENFNGFGHKMQYNTTWREVDDRFVLIAR
jgi:hypothetical protein